MKAPAKMRGKASGKNSASPSGETPEKTSTGVPAARPELAQFRPYEVGPQDSSIKLDANESPFGLPAHVLEDLTPRLAGFPFNRYPDPNGGDLRRELARKLDVPENWIVIGNGADELVFDLVLAYGGPGRKVITFPPTFSTPDLAAGLLNAELTGIPRAQEDFMVDAGPSLFQTIERANIVFFCNPNNPTGTEAPLEFAEVLADMCGGLVVVDEAYADFCSVNHLPLIKKHPNLAVLRTFSKAYSLAGMRVGYLVAHPEVARTISKVKLPYNVGGMSQLVALLALRHAETCRSRVEWIVAEREWLREELERTPGVSTVYPSGANFLLFRTKVPAMEAWQGLLDRGVAVRSFRGDPLIGDCLRVTVGASEENLAFLSALRGVLEGEEKRLEWDGDTLD